MARGFYFPKSSVFSVILVWLACCTAAKFKDPWGHYCFDDDCYEILGVEKNATKADIRKAYRTLSLEWHPDKNKSPEADEKFQKIAKAYTVLFNDEQREKYNHHKENQDEYWNEFGHYWYMAYTAQSDVRMVVIGIVIFVSIFQPMIQYHKYQQATKYLIHAAYNGLGLKQGGTKMTLEIRRQADEILAQQSPTKTPKELRGKKGSKKSSTEQAKQLKAIIEDLVDKVEIHGGHRKPTVWDVPLVQLCMLPVTAFNWVKFNAEWFYKHSYQNQPYSKEEKEYLARRELGAALWEEMEPQDKARAIELEIWTPGALEEYQKEQEKKLMEQRPGTYKRMLRYRKKHQGDKFVMDDE
mmetsp:Transcript_6049/g.9167  ORF Transcript_6049/g.9167 Transcript_6049/m.9167 type:complete len:354 (-) Transcript_6049:147-1208(-)